MSKIASKIRFGISDQDYAKIQDVISSYPDIERVVIYGSRATGNHKPGSDIDLTIEGSMDWDAFHRVEFDLDELMLPYQFDLSLIKHIDNLQLLDHIKRLG